MAEIIYEDSSVFVVKKPAGVESQRGKTFAMDLESELKNLLARRNPGKMPYLGVVHRLDRPVTGIMVYAKTKQAAASLSDQFQKGGAAHKIYEALVLGNPPDEEQKLQNWIVTDKKSNYSRICEDGQEKEAREAVLLWKAVPWGKSVFCLEKDPEMPERRMVKIGDRKLGTVSEEAVSLLYPARIVLETGRHHQIRVQLSHAGCPVAGDFKYGHAVDGISLGGALLLCAVSLKFRHPATGKICEFHI